MLRRWLFRASLSTSAVCAPHVVDERGPGRHMASERRQGLRPTRLAEALAAFVAATLFLFLGG